MHSGASLADCPASPHLHLGRLHCQSVSWLSEVHARSRLPGLMFKGRRLECAVMTQELSSDLAVAVLQCLGQKKGLFWMATAKRSCFFFCEGHDANVSKQCSHHTSLSWTKREILGRRISLSCTNFSMYRPYHKARNGVANIAPPLPKQNISCRYNLLPPPTPSTKPEQSI